MMTLLLTVAIAVILLAAVPFLLGILEMVVELFGYPVFRSFLFRLTIYFGLILLIAFGAAQYIANHLR